MTCSLYVHCALAVEGGAQLRKSNSPFPPKEFKTFGWFTRLDLGQGGRPLQAQVERIWVSEAGMSGLPARCSDPGFQGADGSTPSTHRDTNLHDDLPVLGLVDVPQHVFNQQREVHLVHGHVGQGGLLEKTRTQHHTLHCDSGPLSPQGLHLLIRTLLRSPQAAEPLSCRAELYVKPPTSSVTDDPSVSVVIVRTSVFSGATLENH